MPRRFAVTRFTPNGPTDTTDQLSIEEPLQLLLNGQPFATLMRTPGEDTHLTTGFLFSEGLITNAADILSLTPTTHPTSQEISITLRPGLVPQPTARATHLSSSCGVCGRAEISSLLARLDPITPLDVPPTLLSRLPALLTTAQQEFSLTGGTHAAALFDLTGNCLACHEDVGRHNALDKLIGAALSREELPLSSRILVMSSRSSFDIIQKAALAGLPAVATLGAASSLAAQLAHSAGIALYCFVRESSAVHIPPTGIRSNG